MTYTTEELEAVPHYDGEPCVCAWCSDNVAAVVVRHDPICVDCRTIAYERSLLQKIAALTQERDRLAREREKQRVIIEALEAQIAGMSSNPPHTGQRPRASISPNKDTGA